MSHNKDIVAKKEAVSRISKRMEIRGKTVEFPRLEKFHRSPHNLMDYDTFPCYNLSINGEGGMAMESTVLTIEERLKDLRKERKLTLEALAEATHISRAALGKYESGDFKDISPFSVVTLAKFYGVTTDYLMGVSNIENQPDAEMHELQLTNDALRALKNGGFNGKLLSEVICHKDFQRLMIDMEIFVDRDTSLHIDSLNNSMGALRNIVQSQYDPGENELFSRTLEVARVPGDEYISSVLRDDLTDILRDIRESGRAEKKRKGPGKDKNAISQLAAMEEFQKKVQSATEEKGSSAERITKIYLAAFGIDYDSLTTEEFVVLMGILEKSSYKETSINRRGRRQAALHKRRKK